MIYHVYQHRPAPSQAHERIRGQAQAHARTSLSMSILYQHPQSRELPSTPSRTRARSSIMDTSISSVFPASQSSRRFSILTPTPIRILPPTCVHPPHPSPRRGPSNSRVPHAEQAQTSQCRTTSRSSRPSNSCPLALQIPRPQPFLEPPHSLTHSLTQHVTRYTLHVTHPLRRGVVWFKAAT